MKPHAFTSGQQRQLQQLLDADALDSASAKGPYDPAMRGFSAMVIGKLRDFGLADSRVVRTGRGSQHTAYWLTPDGVTAARELAVA